MGIHLGTGVDFGDAKLRHKTMTYADAAGTGAVGTVDLFTVTGEILITAIMAKCTTNLAGTNATITLGVANDTNLFIAATTATEIDANEFWVSTTPTAYGIALPAELKDIVTDQKIQNEVAVAAVSAGVIEYHLYYVPLSSDGSVVAA